MHWPSVLLIVAIIVGHALIVRALLNVVYTIGMPQRVWNFVCVLHLLVGVAIPVVFVRQVGIKGPRVMKRGDWSRVAPPWIAYGGLCGAALLAVPAANVWGRLRRPAALLGRRAEVVRPDAAADGGGDAHRGAGPAAWLGRFPGNELLRVEVAEQQLALPRLPPAWDGLSVLHLTDLHFNGSPGRPFFEWALARGAAMKPDLVALTGDILDRQAFAEWLPSTLGQFDAPLGCYFVLGNHDACAQPEQTRAALVALGWVDVGGGRQVTRKLDSRVSSGDSSANLLIAGTEVPWLGKHPDISAAPPAALRILLSHAPHHFAWASRQGFDLVLAGHLHGGQVRLPLFGSITGGRYEAGTFQRGRSVMHVSRGLGQIAPVRFRCPPEITKLVLRAPGKLRHS